MYQLDIEQTLNTPIQQVFNAWTQAELIKAWFAPGDMTVPEAYSEPSTGGKYKIVMQEPDGEQHIVDGEFKRVIPFHTLHFTWQWQDSPNTTLVIINLTEVNENTTLLKLNHSEFTEAEFRDKHQHGWLSCLANLQKVA